MSDIEGQRRNLRIKVDETGKALEDYVNFKIKCTGDPPGRPLTDIERKSHQYQSLKREYDAAFKALREFNKKHKPVRKKLT